MKRLLVIVVFFLAAVFFVNQSFAIFETPTPEPTINQNAISPQYAACDQCGYCPPNPPPGSWSACQKCLYPGITNTDPATQDSSKETLKIDPVTNLAIAPAKGRQYTFLGCISTNVGSFSQEGGAGSVIQILLKTIFSIVGGVAFLYLLYGAFVLATSQNDPEKLNYGKRLIYGAIIGLIFSLTSVLLINFLASQVLKIPGFGEGGTP